MRRLVGVALLLASLFGLVPSAAAEPVGLPALAVDLGDAEQVVLVRGRSWSSSYATLEAYERTGDTWTRVLGPVTARIGRRGFSLDRSEGDGTSPAGVFTLTEAFGLFADPGSGLPYRQAGMHDWWVSDPASPLYNTWQVGPSAGRWNPAKGERLAFHAPSQYGHAVVIDYNRSPVVPGKGSAMFLHIVGRKATSGCVAVPKRTVVSLLQWLDPARRPVIAMGPDAWLRGA